MLMGLFGLALQDLAALMERVLHLHADVKRILMECISHYSWADIAGTSRSGRPDGYHTAYPDSSGLLTLLSAKKQPADNKIYVCKNFSNFLIHLYHIENLKTRQQTV